MRKRALQAVGIIALVMSSAMCSFSAYESALDPSETGDFAGTGAAGQGDGDVLKGGGPIQKTAESSGGMGGMMGTPGGGGNTGGNANSGGAGGAGGTGGVSDKPDPVLEACKVQAESTSLYASFSVDDSNALASPSYVRDILTGDESVAPDSALIKEQEFLNYYDFSYPEPGVEAVGITAALRPIGATTYRLLVGVTAPPAPSRPRMNLSIVVDASVSMGNAGIARAKAVVKAIGKSLRQGDVVSLVTWHPEGQELKGHIVTGADDAKLTEVVSALAIDGGSDLQSALTRGSALAEHKFDPSAGNRLILISDGRVTVGPWETGLVEARALGKDTEKPVLLVGAATGPADGYDETFMTKLTKAGRGAYVYVSSEADAARLFHGRFDEVVGAPAFDNVKLTISAPGYFSVPGLDDSDGSTGPLPPSVGDVVGRPLAPGDSMTFNQIMTTCHEDIINNNDLVTITISWVKRGTFQAGTTEAKPTVGALRNNTDLGLRKAAAVPFFVEALRSGASADLQAAWAEINSLNGAWKPSIDMPGEADLEEMMALIKRHPNYP